MSVIAANVFSVVDYIVLGVMILTSVVIGTLCAYRDKNDQTPKTYFLGSRKLKALPVGLSFVVTFQSSILIIGFPAEAYAYGMQYVVQCIGIMAAYFLASVIVVPVLHPLKVTTVYQYYGIRFGNNYVRFLALFCGAIYFTFYMGIVMYGTGLALQSAAGIPSWASVLAVATAATLYTTLGGFQSVIWTDVFQALIMVVGILGVLIKTTTRAGGITEAVKLSKSRMNFFDFNPDPTLRHTFWTLVVGGFSHFLYNAVSQASIQRINSTPTVTAAKRLFYIAGPVYSFIFALVMIQGLTIFAYYSHIGCDPLANGQIDNVNMIIPLTIVELFHDSPGLPGLFLSALAASSLSTISSGLSCLSAMSYEDCIKLLPLNISDRTGTTIARIMTVVYGFLSMVFAFMLSNVRGPLGQIMTSMMSSVVAPELGVYLCCVFFHKTTTKGAVVGMITGFAFAFWLSIGQTFLAIVPDTPYLPSGPVDKCFDSRLIPNSTYDNVILKNATMHFVNNANYSMGDMNYTLSNSNDDHVGTSTSAINTLYSISYMYFHLIGCIVVIVVCIAVSLLTQPDQPVDIDKTTVLPLSVLVPSCCKTLYTRLRSKWLGRSEVPAEPSLELSQTT